MSADYGVSSISGLLCLAVSTFISLLLLYFTIRLAVRHAIRDTLTPQPAPPGPEQWKPLNPPNPK